MTSTQRDTTAYAAYRRADAAAAHAGETAARILRANPHTTHRRAVFAFAETAEKYRQIAGDHYRSGNQAAATIAADVAAGAAAELDRRAA